MHLLHLSYLDINYITNEFKNIFYNAHQSLNKIHTIDIN